MKTLLSLLILFGAFAVIAALSGCVMYSAKIPTDNGIAEVSVKRIQIGGEEISFEGEMGQSRVSVNKKAEGNTQALETARDALNEILGVQ